MSQHDQTTPPSPQDKADAGSRSTLVRGAVLLVIAVALIALWPFINGRGHGQQVEAFAKANPELVAIGGGGAPVITSDDVSPRFYAIGDMASPAEIAMATEPLFDRVTPKVVWIFAEKTWADGAHGVDLGELVDSLKARDISVVLILPPQNGETDDAALDAFATLANDKDITFLDYHDGDKLGTALCPAPDANSVQTEMGAAAASAGQTYMTQQMLLHMAINAPATRSHLRLPEIGARIERLKAETTCPGETDPVTGAPVDEEAAPAGDAAVEADTPAEDGGEDIPTAIE
jgi:hypothetical protein